MLKHSYFSGANIKYFPDFQKSLHYGQQCHFHQQNFSSSFLIFSSLSQFITLSFIPYTQKHEVILCLNTLSRCPKTHKPVSTATFFPQIVSKYLCYSPLVYPLTIPRTSSFFTWAGRSSHLVYIPIALLNSNQSLDPESKSFSCFESN